MPPHRVYIELFLGSGAVLRNKRRAESSIGIELDDRALAEWSSLTDPSVTIEQRDAFDFLSAHQFEKDHLLYADPPYLPSTRRRARVYKHDLDEGGHIRLLEMLAPLQCAVMISGYPSDLYDRMLTNWGRTEFHASSQAGLRREVIWHNFEPSPVLHDYGHLGDTFRERERLKRKVGRWRRRIEAMPEGERQALLSALGEIASRAPVRTEPLS